MNSLKNWLNVSVVRAGAMETSHIKTKGSVFHFWIICRDYKIFLKKNTSRDTHTYFERNLELPL